MRILHISSEHPPQQVFGLGRYVCDLARAQVDLSHSVHVLTNSIGGIDQDVIDNGVHLHRVDFPPPPKPPGVVAPPLAFNLHLQQRAAVLGADRLGHPQVVVSHDWLTAIAGDRIARRLGIAHIWTVHDTVLGKTFGRIADPADSLSAGIERWAGQRADLVLVNSRLIYDEIVQGYGCDASKIRLLHCGVKPETYLSRQSSRRLAAFRQVFAQPDEILFTYVGRLALEKGIDTLINAFAAIRATGICARLAIAGTGDLEPVIRKHIDDLGLEPFVSFHGYLRGEVLAALYAVSDAHVCPSHYEPFGLVAVEAMAAGTPIVVSDTGGLAEIVSRPSVGRVVTPRDHTALASVLTELARDPALRKKLGKAGARHVRTHFAWPVIARRSLEFYSEVVTDGVLPMAMRAATA